MSLTQKLPMNCMHHPCVRINFRILRGRLEHLHQVTQGDLQQRNQI